MGEQVLEGGCQCGSVRYSVSGESLMAAICHCRMCRRAHAAPAVAWAMFGEAQVSFSGAPPKRFNSSQEAQRGFCAQCGTPLCFTASFLPGLVDISIGSLDDPQAIRPSMHCWYSQHLDWATFADTLPRHAELPPWDG